MKRERDKKIKTVKAVEINKKIRERERERERM